MSFLSNYLKSSFSHFSYFYSILRYRIIVAVITNFSVGLLDGFGLAMFLPLLELADGSKEVDTKQLGGFSFLIDGFDKLNVPVTLTTVLIVMLLFFVVKGIAKFMEIYLKVKYQQFFMYSIRIQNIDLFSNLTYDGFIRSDAGRIQNTFTGEVERVNNAFRDYFYAVQCGISVLVYIMLAFFANPQFALFVAIGGALTNFIFKKLYTRTKKLSHQLVSINNEFQGFLIQSVTNFKYLKATGTVYKYVEKLKNNILGINTFQQKIGLLNATLQAIREPLVILVVVVVILLQINYFGQSFSLILLSLIFLYRSLSYLMSLQNYWNLFLSSSGSLDNLQSFTQELKSNQEIFGNARIPSFDKNIRLTNVGFSIEQTSILKNISIELTKNETLAIVGPSGSGKTTLINILCGLLKPNSGSVSIDDLDLQVLNIRDYQKRIGYITQEPVVFNDSVYNNITLWDTPNVENRARFNTVLSMASLDDFLASLDKQEYTILGHNGVNLSGGQKQRIAIARELYKRADILIMDEATSALDSGTEEIIKQSIEKLKGKLTIVIIAHRLSTIKHADRILVLDKGKIVDVGDFKSLSATSALFKHMVSMQEF